MFIREEFIKTIKERAAKSKVYKKYQFIGLIIAQLLADERHKSLYIKLTKEYNPDYLLNIAKDVSERKQIKNKGGYFMRILTKTHPYLLKSQKSKIKK